MIANPPALFIDTETTGLDPYSCRLVELACVLVNPDASVDVWDTLIRPVDFAIPWDAERVHGISNEEAHSTGIPLQLALAELTSLALRARPGWVIGHNLRFDLAVLGSEYKRAESKLYPLNHLTPFCTMVALTERMGLPGKYGKYKWPRLDEAYRYCLGEDRPLGTHRALSDALACKAIYDHGVAQQWWHGGREVDSTEPQE